MFPGYIYASDFSCVDGLYSVTTFRASDNFNESMNYGTPFPNIAAWEVGLWAWLLINRDL
jgi:hypothetical protein